MSSMFGSDYPPGCHSLPWDDEPDDERCGLERWVERWLGTGWDFEPHHLYKGEVRKRHGWTLVVTLLWVYRLYWRRSPGWFNLRLSLLKAGQSVHPDDEAAQILITACTETNWNLGTDLRIGMLVVQCPIQEQLVKASFVLRAGEEYGVPMQRWVDWKVALKPGLTA